MLTERKGVFLNAKTGTAAVYDPTGTNSSIFVNLDEPSLEELEIRGTNPTAEAWAGDIPGAGAAIGKVLRIGSTDYTIVGRQPVDDGAFVRLQLKR